MGVRTERATALPPGAQPADEPRVGIVIPAYKQPQFLGGAIESALVQRLAGGVRIVIVNDGCPYESTETIALALRDHASDSITYVRQANAGVAAARNTGIESLLRRWPSIEAIFPLDADNRLSAGTLEHLLAALDAEEGVGWSYPTLEAFGSECWQWSVPGPFSSYRQLFDNQCDAGSLISREIFDAGVFFEPMGGYEDWEFFVSASALGYRGRLAGRCGFMYRKRPNSMLDGARQEHERLSARIRARHSDLYRPRRLTEHEHADLPRFAIFDLDRGTVDSCSCLDIAPRTDGAAEFVSAVAQASHKERGAIWQTPPLCVLVPTDVRQWLADVRLLPGLLLRAQRELKEAPAAGFAIESGDDGFRIEMGPAAPGSTPSLLVLRTKALFEAMRDGFDEPLAQARITRIVVDRGLEPPLDRVDRRRLAALLDVSATTGESSQIFKQFDSHYYFSEYHHLESGETTFPWVAAPTEARKSVFMLLPWVRLGGVDRAMIELAAAVREESPDISLHLVITERAELESATGALKPFDTVTLLADLDRATAAALLGRMLAGADAVVNSHSWLGYEALGLTDPDTVRASLLHTFDYDSTGAPTGFPPLVASVAQESIDLVMVPSALLRAQIANLGVVADKIRIASNAPVICPPTVADGLSIAAGKSRRAAGGGAPLRLLYAGRLDRQKGVARLSRISRHLELTEVEFELVVVGDALLEAETGDFSPLVEFVPATFDREALAQRFADADVLLLPSRWEGVPLVMLDAMTFGCLVVATDVGAVGEVLADGVNGFLLGSQGEDDEIAAAATTRLTEIARGAPELASIREQAVRDAFALRWRDSAMALLEGIEWAAGTINGSTAASQ